MATNTPNLNLLKKNPTQDYNDTFNIDTMLNENWDKIDIADAENIKRAKLLEEIKQIDGENSGVDADTVDGKQASGTLNTNDKNNLVTAINEVDSRTTDLETELSSKINKQVITLTNESSTQHITAKQNCGVDVEIGGEMVVNFLGRIGNFEKDSNGDGLADGLISVVSTDLSTENNIQKFTPTAWGGRIHVNGTTLANQRYYVSAEVKTLDNQVGVNFINQGKTPFEYHSGSGDWEHVSQINYTDTDYDNAFGVYTHKENGFVPIEVRNFMVINLTSLFASGNEPTKEWCDNNITYINSAQSLVNFTVDVCGKNLLKGFLNTDYTHTCSNNNVCDEILEYTATASYQHSFVIVPAKPNTQYTMSCEMEGWQSEVQHPYIHLFSMNNKGKATSLLTVMSEVSNARNSATGTTPSDAMFLIIYFTNYSGGTYKFIRPQLEQGSTLTQYEYFKGGSIIFSTELARSNTLQDKLTYRDGKVIVDRKVKHIELSSSNRRWNFANSESTWKVINTDNISPLGLIDSQIIVKHDGRILDVYHYGIPDTGPDQSFFQNHLLWLTIANTDSGWGENYNSVSDEEIKAYFNGWKMSSDGIDSIAPYNGTGTKYWTPLGSFDGNRYYGLYNGSGTPTEPPNPSNVDGWTNNDGWKPYILYYALQESIQEDIQSIILGDGVNLVEGQNTLTVKSGYVWEKAEPVINAANINYLINALPNTSANNTNNDGSLKYKPKNVYRIFKDKDGIKVDDTSNWTYEDLPAYYHGGNGYYQSKDIYDPQATYYILYEIIQEDYNCQVQNAEISYEDNIRGAFNEAVEEIHNIQGDVSKLNLDSIKGSGEQIERGEADSPGTITFSQAFSDAPTILLTAKGSTMPYVSSVTATSFTLEGSGAYWMAIGK